MYKQSAVDAADGQLTCSERGEVGVTAEERGAGEGGAEV
jgi:hypothetical protein